MSICLNNPLQIHNVHSYFHMSSVTVYQTRRLSTFSFAHKPVCVHPHSKTGTLIDNTKKRRKINTKTYFPNAASFDNSAQINEIWDLSVLLKITVFLDVTVCKEVKVKVFMYTKWKLIGGAQLYFHSLLMPEFDGGKLSVSHPGNSTPWERTPAITGETNLALPCVKWTQFTYTGQFFHSHQLMHSF